MADQDDLLSQLKIDRSAPVKSGVPMPVFLVSLLAIVAIGFFAAPYVLGPSEQEAIVAETQTVDASGAKEAATVATEKPEVATEPTPEPSAFAARVQSDKVLDASGYITPRRIATVSAELTGRIIEVLVEEGMQVEKGQVLARLDDAVAQVNLRFASAQAASAEAQVMRAEASVAEAKRVLERVSSLNTNDFSSKARLTNAEAAVETTTADLARTKADLDAARYEVARQQERLDDHTVRAPFGGVVTVKNAQEGEIVAPGSAGGGFTRTGICTIVDMNSLEIEVDVNEAFIGRVFEGQKVAAKLDAYPDWDIPARVIAIIPTADRNKATVRVRVGIDVRDKRILPDMGVKVSFLETQA